MSIVGALAGCYLPAEPSPPFVAPPSSARPALYTARDAFALLEASPTIDGYPVGSAPGAAATVVVVFASWCGHCRDQLATIDRVRAAHPGVRVIGVNYRAHEEYDGKGDAWRVRAYVAAQAPWLTVVPAGEPLFAALGRPPKIPTLYIYDRGGALIRVYDRRVDRLPTAGDLDVLVAQLGG